jgi:hypothetical protein
MRHICCDTGPLFLRPPHVWHARGTEGFLHTEPLQSGFAVRKYTVFVYLKYSIKNCRKIDWLFYVPLKNFSLIWRRHHYRRRAAKFRPMLGAQSLWAGRDLYRAPPAVTRGLGFSGLIWRTAPFSRLFRHTMGCGESNLNPDPHRCVEKRGVFVSTWLQCYYVTKLLKIL